MADNKKVQAAKKLRKALQIALSQVDLDGEDVADLVGVFDPFDPTMKYKKGMIVTVGGVAYICIKTVKSGVSPASDPDHWQLVPGASTDPGDGGEGGETETPDPDPGTDPDPEEPEVPEYDPETSYNKGDQVTHNGQTWTCQKNNVQGIEPGTDDKYWAQA